MSSLTEHEAAAKAAFSLVSQKRDLELNSQSTVRRASRILVQELRTGSVSAKLKN